MNIDQKIRAKMNELFAHKGQISDEYIYRLIVELEEAVTAEQKEKLEFEALRNR
jgi:hypothetical protein